MKTKTIAFTEYTYVLHAYPAEVEISIEDFNKLKVGEIDLEVIQKKYDDINYGCSEPNYDISYIDSFEYEGEV